MAAAAPQCAPLQSLRLAQSNLEELPPLAPGQLSALTSLAIEWAGLLASFPPSWCLPSLQVQSHQPPGRCAEAYCFRERALQ